MRVYVLGAGASVHAKYPLASALGTSLAAWIDTLPSDHRYHLRLSQVIDVYGALDNFEVVLADLMTCPPGSPEAGLPPGVRPYLLSDLKEAIREHFDTIRTSPAPLYDELAHGLNRGDMVITYNYDLAIERALGAIGMWDIGTGYGFPIRGEDRLHLSMCLSSTGVRTGVRYYLAAVLDTLVAIVTRWVSGRSCSFDRT